MQKRKVSNLTHAALSALVLLLAAAPMVADTGGTKTATSVWWVVFNHPDSCATSPPGLKDAQAAEIHIVVRSHGPAIEGLESEQITLFLEPGCEDLGGPNVCEDIQFSIHQPGAGMMSDVWRNADGSVVTGASSKLIRGDGFVKLILNTRIK